MAFVFLTGIVRAQEQPETLPQLWSLEQCIDYAVSHNITIQQAEYTLSSSELTYAQSKYERFPSLSASASHTMTNGTSIDPITSDFVNQLIQSSSFALNSQVIVYNGGKINNQIRQNRLLAEKDQLYIQEAKNSIILSVTEAFLQAQYYREGIRTAENTLISTQKQLEQTQMRFLAGAVSSKDVADLQSQLAQNAYSVVTAQNAYQQQVLALKQLLELQQDQPFVLVDLSPDETGAALIPEKADVYNAALNRLPEIKAAKLDSQINELNVTIAKAGYLPSLTLSGSMASGYTNTQDLVFGEQLRGNFNQRLMLSLNVPVFSRYQNKTKVEQARINVLKSELSVQSEQKDLYKKIETAWQNATAAQSELISAIAARDAAKLAYDIAQQQFEKGGLDPISLAVTQNTWLNAEQSYLQAKYMSILYIQLLQFYQGNEIKI